MTKTMEEKVALVTGSAMGIGLACAEAFAKAGYITVLADIREPGEQVEKLVAEGQKAVAYRCDVSNTQAVKEMIDWTVATYGRLDAALNNAGIQTPQRPMAEITDDEFDVRNVVVVSIFSGVFYRRFNDFNTEYFRRFSRQKERNGSCAAVGIDHYFGPAQRSVFHCLFIQDERLNRIDLKKGTSRDMEMKIPQSVSNAVFPPKSAGCFSHDDIGFPGIHILDDGH